MKLLVVEDDPPLQSALLRLLSQWGYATEMATTAGEALGWLERELFDLVLLDLGLPDCDGLSLCRQLRRLPMHQPLVLMLTARVERADKVRGFEEGADDYVAKPFDPELLRARLQALLRRACRPLQHELAFGPVRLLAGQRSPARRSAGRLRADRVACHNKARVEAPGYGSAQLWLGPWRSLATSRAGTCCLYT